MADACILRLYTFLEWTKDMVSEDAGLRTGPLNHFNDKVFECEMNLAIRDCEAAYEKMQYREALKLGFFQLQASRDKYRELSIDGMHKDLVMKYIRTQVLMLSPICPHITDYVWRSVLGHASSILHERWPESGDIDLTLMQSSQYLLNCAHEFRVRLKNMMHTIEHKNKTKAKKPQPAASTSPFGDLKKDAGLRQLDAHLANRSYIDGFGPSSADRDAHKQLSQAPDASKFPHARRWCDHIGSFSEKERATFPKSTAKENTAAGAGGKKKAAEPVESKKPTKSIVYVAKEYPAWQKATLICLNQMYEENNGVFPGNKEIMNVLKTDDAVKKNMKKLMPFVAHIKGNVEKEGVKAMALQVPFDEQSVLIDNITYLMKAIELDIEVKSSEGEDQKIQDECAPGKPFTVFQA
jgi:leucyl-tRNA synthetase